jgi:signal transduction histidine kinase
MGQVLEDGRSAVRGMRLSKERMQNPDLAFSRIPQELAVQASAGFRVMVEGTPRSMHPAVRDEVYCIAREAVTNAFRHSRATRIEVQLEYGFRELRVLVRDNGCGIDSQRAALRKGGSLGGFRECANGRREWGEAESQQQRHWRDRSGPARPRPHRF